jgi:hypothetical protein
MAEAARRGLVVPSPEPLNDTDSDDIPQSAQKERSHDSDSVSDNEALNMMNYPDTAELPDLVSSGDEEEEGPSLRAQLRREIEQPIEQPKSSSPADVEEAENTTDEDEDDDDDEDDEDGAVRTTVKKKRRSKLGQRAKKDWQRVITHNTQESSQLEIFVGLTSYAKQLYDKSDTPAPSGNLF